MAHAERCLICNGKGVYVTPPDSYDNSLAAPKTCHGCGGKGWVSVEDTYPVKLIKGWRGRPVNRD